MNWKNTSLAIVLSFSGLHCLQTDGPGHWSVNMRGMADSYEKLLPYMFNSKRYSDPNNKQFISTYLKNINQMASGLDQHTGKGLSGNDPLFNVGIKGLKTLIQKSSESYFVENYEYSQRLLQTSLNYCTTCHTRTSIGPSFIQRDKFDDITSQLETLEHTQVLVATRQFSKAISVLESGLNREPWKDSEKKDEALERLLTIILKNEENPNQALEILGHLNLNQLSPKTLKEIPKWKDYLKKWASGKLDKKEHQRELLKSRNKGARPHHFVEALHHSVILHKSLSTEQEKLWRARTYGALGLIYEAYPTLGFWSLPGHYFETCIYESPGSKTALKCYYDLESHIQKESQGFQGQALLKLEEMNLKKLKALASVPKQGPTSSQSGPGSESW